MLQGYLNHTQTETYAHPLGAVLDFQLWNQPLNLENIRSGKGRSIWLLSPNLKDSIDGKPNEDLCKTPWQAEITRSTRTSLQWPPLLPCADIFQVILLPTLEHQNYTCIHIFPELLQ